MDASGQPERVSADELCARAKERAAAQLAAEAGDDAPSSPPLVANTEPADAAAAATAETKLEGFRRTAGGSAAVKQRALTVDQVSGAVLHRAAATGRMMSGRGSLADVATVKHLETIRMRRRSVDFKVTTRAPTMRFGFSAVASAAVLASHRSVLVGASVSTLRKGSSAEATCTGDGRQQAKERARTMVQAELEKRKTEEATGVSGRDFAAEIAHFRSAGGAALAMHGAKCIIALSERQQRPRRGRRTSVPTVMPSSTTSHWSALSRAVPAAVGFRSIAEHPAAPVVATAESTAESKSKSKSATAESFTAESLQSLQFSELKKLALAEGLPVVQVEAALEASNPKVALIELLEPLAAGWGAVDDGAAAAKRANSLAALAEVMHSTVDELLSLTPAELIEVLQEAEASGATVGALGRKRITNEVDALLQQCGATAESFTAESQQSLQFSKLKNLALAEGLNEAQIEAALEVSNPKVALIELLEPLAAGAAAAAADCAEKDVALVAEAKEVTPVEEQQKVPEGESQPEPEPEPEGEGEATPEQAAEPEPEQEPEQEPEPEAAVLQLAAVEPEPEPEQEHEPEQVGETAVVEPAAVEPEPEQELEPEPEPQLEPEAELALEDNLARAREQERTAVAQRVRQSVVDIYTVHNPRKLKHIDELMLQWKGREEDLLQGVEQMYGEQEPEQEPEPEPALEPQPQPASETAAVVEPAAVEPEPKQELQPEPDLEAETTVEHEPEADPEPGQDETPEGTSPELAEVESFEANLARTLEREDAALKQRVRQSLAEKFRISAAGSGSDAKKLKRIDELMLEFEGREEELLRKVQEEMRRKIDLEEEQAQAQVDELALKAKADAAKVQAAKAQADAQAGQLAAVQQQQEPEPEPELELEPAGARARRPMNAARRPPALQQAQEVQGEGEGRGSHKAVRFVGAPVVVDSPNGTTPGPRPTVGQRMSLA